MLCTCQACGKQIEKFDSQIREYTYCSIECVNSPSIPVKCSECGKTFLATGRNYRQAKFCSSECRHGRNRREQVHKKQKQVTCTCAECGKTYSVRTSVAAVQKYCSQSCSGKAIGSTKCGESNPKWKPKVTITCPRCGKLFETHPCRVGRKMYCSKECANQKDTVYCVRCGKAMELQPSRARERVYCSVDCQLIDQAELRKGDKRTSIEVAMASVLDALDVQYVEQYPIRWYACDFYLPDHNLVIECDGDYWHSTPEAKRNDKRKNTYLRKYGYKLLRFSETDINLRIDWCTEQIQNALA